MSSPKAAGSGKLPWLFVLLGVPFLAGGVGVLMLAVHKWRLYGEVRSWAEVPATVRSVEFRTDRDSDGEKVYRVEATYGYEFEGGRYTADRVDIMGGSSSNRSLHRRRYERLKKHRESGKPVTALIDPNDPSRAVLYGEADAWMYALIPFGLVFAGAGVGVTALAVTALRRNTALRQSTAQDARRYWNIREDWRRGLVEASNLKQLLYAWGLGIGLAVFMSIFVVLMAMEGGPWFAWAAVGLFLLIAAVSLLRALVLTGRYLVHSSPVLHLGEVPIVPGRTVAAVIRSARPLEADRWTAELQCFIPSTSSDGHHSEHNERCRELLEEFEGLQEEQETRTGIKFHTTSMRGTRAFERELDPAGETRTDRTGNTLIPFNLRVPADAHATSLEPEFAVTWVLSVKARSFPFSFSADFELPVFYADESEIDRLNHAHSG
ncbi:MAG: DUF3592 domain-containing protein [Planctomycetota bacterium]